MTVFRNSAARVTGVSNLVDLDLHFHQDRPLSIMVSLDGGPDKWVSFPKSLIEYEGSVGGSVTVTCTRSLAIEKGLESAVE
jgi:hypothetical protein